MYAYKRLEEQNRRMDIQKTWRARFSLLPNSRRDFCIKHDIDTSIITRLINLQMAAGDAWIEKVEKALKDEGL